MISGGSHKLDESPTNVCDNEGRVVNPRDPFREVTFRSKIGEVINDFKLEPIRGLAVEGNGTKGCDSREKFTRRGETRRNTIITFKSRWLAWNMKESLHGINASKAGDLSHHIGFRCELAAQY